MPHLRLSLQASNCLEPTLLGGPCHAHLRMPVFIPVLRQMPLTVTLVPLITPYSWRRLWWAFCVVSCTTFGSGNIMSSRRTMANRTACASWKRRTCAACSQCSCILILFYWSGSGRGKNLERSFLQLNKCFNALEFHSRSLSIWYFRVFFNFIIQYV